MKTCTPSRLRVPRFSETCHHDGGHIEQPFDLPDSSDAIDEPEEPSDIDDLDFEQDDDSDWDVFIPDDEYDPEPDANDFWNNEFSDDE